MSYTTSDELLARTIDFVVEHGKNYLKTGGVEGHIMNMAHAGADVMLPTLLLETFGRKTGKRFINPLIYGVIGGEWVVIGSKGGAPEHPAWYLNLKSKPTTRFQVGTQAFEGTWREAEGEERRYLWDYMAKHYPPYLDYEKAAGDRSIPVVLLKADTEIPVFEV